MFAEGTAREVMGTSDDERAIRASIDMTSPAICPKSTNDVALIKLPRLSKGLIIERDVSYLDGDSQVQRVGRKFRQSSVDQC